MSELSDEYYQTSSEYCSLLLTVEQCERAMVVVFRLHEQSDRSDKSFYDDLQGIEHELVHSRLHLRRLESRMARLQSELAKEYEQ